jgi:hypothetical protein
MKHVYFSDGCVVTIQFVMFMLVVKMTYCCDVYASGEIE